MSITTAKLTLLFVFFLLSIFACEKDEGLTGEKVSFYYEETKCADPWQNSSSASDEILKAHVSEYLHDLLEVDYSGLRITHDGTSEACRACSCRTGRIIRIEADLAYQDVLVESGFRVE